MKTEKETSEKPRGGRFAKGGTAGPGRPKGVPNKATQAIKALAQAMTTGNPKWVQATKARLVAGTEHSSVVVTLLHYAHGRPVERVEVGNPDGTPLFGDTDPKKLAALAEASA